jgi:hypothetical protein
MKSKVPVSQIPANSESEAALTDAIVPAFLTEEQAATYVGESAHQFYVRRRKGTGPPFVMHGVRVRYPIDDLKRWAAALPRYTSRAQALVANPKRAAAARRQAATSPIARAAKRAKSNQSANSEA